MFTKAMNYVMGGLIALMLVAAGPVAIALTLTVPQGYTKVQQVFDTTPMISNGFLLVQDAGSATADPNAAATATDAVPLTENQGVVVEYGNWVRTVLVPFKEFALSLIPLIAGFLMLQVPSWLRMFIPATRVNQLLEQAINNAFVGVAGAAAGKKLSVEVTNNLLRQGVIYAVSQAPGLVGSVASKLPLLLQKLMARLPLPQVPAGYSVDAAVKAVTPASIKAAATKQGVGDPLNAYLGT